METEQNEKQEKNWAEVADKLDLLQKDKNEGRGVSCVQSIVSFLRGGDVKRAKVIARWDRDKIINYPDIEKFLEDNIFMDDPDSPIKNRKRMAEKFGWEVK